MLVIAERLTGLAFAPEAGRAACAHEHPDVAPYSLDRGGHLA